MTKYKIVDENDYFLDSYSKKPNESKLIKLKRKFKVNDIRVIEYKPLKNLNE